MEIVLKNLYQQTQNNTNTVQKYSISVVQTQAKEKKKKRERRRRRKNRVSYIQQRVCSSNTKTQLWSRTKRKTMGNATTESAIKERN
jgi:hypothetical protein